MKYEGLFILKNSALSASAKDDPTKAAIDRIESEIKVAGGSVLTVQKMDKRPFARVADRRHTSGLYVNVIFEGTPGAVATLRNKFALNEDVFRVAFTRAAAVPPPPPSPVIPAATPAR